MSHTRSEKPWAQRISAPQIAFMMGVALACIMPSAGECAPSRGERAGARSGEAGAARGARGGRQEAPLVIPDNVEVKYDIPYREGNEMWKLDLAMPRERGDAPRPAIVFIHGGGWATGDKRTGYFWRGAVEYAQMGYVCITVNYRLVGEAIFPACVQDVRCAVRWLRAHAEEYNVDPDRIGGFGHSAGAHLVALLGVAPDEAPEIDEDAPYQEYSSLLNAVCCSATPANFYPFDEQKYPREGPSLLLGERDEGWENRAKLASPVFHANADAPPYLIIHGTTDEIVPLAQATQLADALTAAGAKDVTLLMIYKVGHDIFMQHQDITLPALERFFERTLMTEQDQAEDEPTVPPATAP